VDESIAGLEACQVQYILWEPFTGIGTVEERAQARGDHLDPMRAYIQQDFKRAQVFANGSEIWMRMKRDNLGLSSNRPSDRGGEEVAGGFVLEGGDSPKQAELGKRFSIR
jgi:hypothetical protein